MNHLSENKPKHLLEVRGKPFLYYLLNNLQIAGYQEMIVVVGYRGEQIEKFLREQGYRVTLVNQFDILGDREYGSACPLKCVKEYVQGDDFLVVNGDNLYSVRDLKKMNLPDQYNYVAGLPHDNPQLYGVLIRDGQDKLEKIIEKPKHEVGSNLINTGVYKFTAEVFDYLPQIKLSERGEYEITDVISLMARDRKVRIQTIEDYWFDFGKPEDIEILENFLKK